MEFSNLHMKFFTQIITLCLLFSAQLQATSLNESLIKVYEKNLALRSAMQEKKTAEIGCGKAFASFLPSANAKLQHQYSIDNDTNDLEISVNISENLSLQQISQYKGAKQRYQLAELQFSANEQAIFMETVKLYMNILSLQSMLDLNEKKIHVLETSLDAAETRFKMGNSTITDVENVKLKLNLAKTENLQIKNNLEIYNIQYRNLMLDEYDLYNHMLNNKSNTDPISANYFIMPCEHDLIPLPYEHSNIANIKIKSLAKNFEISNTIVESSEAAFFPTFGIQLGRNFTSHDRYQQTNPMKPYYRSASSDSTSLTAQISFNIFKGGADVLNVRESKANRQKAKYDFLDYKLKLQAENQNYWNNLELARAKQQYVEAAIQSAQITLKGVTKEYEMGTKNILDLLSAQQEFFSAESELINAHKDYIIAHYSLIAQANKLTIENIRKAVKNV